MNSLRMISRRIDCGNLSCGPNVFHVSIGKRLSRLSIERENLESLLVDWKRQKISYCDSIPLLEILLDHSKNSSALAFPAFVK